MTLALDDAAGLGNADWTDNWTLGDGLRIEIMNTATNDVWICQSPVTAERAESLAVPDGYGRALEGQLIADAAYFRRSPGADSDDPVEVMDIDGLRFARIGRFAGLDPLDGRSGGPITDAQVWSIDKHHSMLYVAGRTIEVLDFGDGTSATPAWSPRTSPAQAGKTERLVPSEWSMRTVRLTHDLITEIPNPARVAVFGDGSGFHGPIPDSTIEKATS